MLLSLLILLSPAAQAQDPALRAALSALLPADEVPALLSHLEQEEAALARRLEATGPVDPEALRQALNRQIVNNLTEKQALRAMGVSLDAQGLQRRVLDYELFKLETYISAGVFPKRYFGYFDLQGDSAQAEWELRELVSCATPALNEHLAQKGVAWRVNEAEIAVTFISEGGAILLREDQDRINSLDPVMDVGLDDLALGGNDLVDLIQTLDARCGTSLGTLITWTAPNAAPPPGAWGRLNSPDGRWGWLTRMATYHEGIMGTALMWMWEKDIASRKLKNEGRTPLHDRDLATQYVIGSLVYNSGILHAEDTIQMLVRLQTGGYLYERSEANADRRPRLNLLPPPRLLAEALALSDYRDQPTSWVGVYHVAQRYGAWEALRRFTDTFDAQGRFTPKDKPLAPSPKPTPAEAAAPEQGTCSAAGGAAPSGLLALLALVVRRQRPQGSGTI